MFVLLHLCKFSLSCSLAAEILFRQLTMCQGNYFFSQNIWDQLWLLTESQCPTGTRYPTRTRNIFQYPIRTRFIFKIIGYIGYRVLMNIMCFNMNPCAACLNIISYSFIFFYSMYIGLHRSKLQSLSMSILQSIACFGSIAC